MLLALHLGAGAQVTLWNVRAVLPDGLSLPVQAFDPQGGAWPVMALEEGNMHLLNVRAVVRDQRLPVKVLVSDEAFLPVKAIGPDGAIWDVKAVTPDGARLDVKGVAHAGHIVHIKAIGPRNELYGVKAVSPTGMFHDVKGIRMEEDEGALVNGARIHAHVKALPQAVHTDEEPIWNVEALAEDGTFLPVKAVGAKGELYDVRAFLENGDRWVLDVKALVGGRKVAVKVLPAGEGAGVLKAILPDGASLPLKAIANDGRRWDVVGTLDTGTIIHVKAVGPDGARLGVKAISPRGAQYDVKGLRFGNTATEAVVGGVEVKAHVKALPPAP